MEYTLLSCVESRVKSYRNYYSRFYIGPFLKNNAITYANTLRRVLLSDTSNIVIDAVMINNAKHEYSFLNGVKESILDILLNLKQIVFINKKFLFKTTFYFAYLHSFGPKVVRANDIILPAFLNCIDNKQYIATLSSNTDLTIKMKLINNIVTLPKFSLNYNCDYLLDNYLDYVINKNEFFFKLEGNFSAVNKVNYFLESSNELENISDFVSLEIWTNGSLVPMFAIQNSIKLIINLFISGYDITSLTSSLIDSSEFLKIYLYFLSNRLTLIKNNFFKSSNEFKYYNNFIINNDNLSIDNLEIPNYSKYKLRKANVFTLNDFTRFDERTLMSLFDLSFKSLTIIKKKMLSYNLNLK